MKALSFSDLPFNWAVCYQTDCPLTTRFLRLHGGSVLPLSQRTWPAVTPKQHSSDGCPLFVALTQRGVPLAGNARPACGTPLSRLRETRFPQVRHVFPANGKTSKSKFLVLVIHLIHTPRPSAAPSEGEPKIYELLYLSNTNNHEWTHE